MPIGTALAALDASSATVPLMSASDTTKVQAGCCYSVWCSNVLWTYEQVSSSFKVSEAVSNEPLPTYTGVKPANGPDWRQPRQHKCPPRRPGGQILNI